MRISLPLGSPLPSILYVSIAGPVAPTLLDVSYRKAKVEDFPGILNLIRTSFDGVLREHGFFDSSPFASSKLPAIPQQGFPWFEMGLKEDGEGFWVAEVEGKLAGLTLSWVRGSLWYLAHLFVSPEHQGLNIGQNLMERAMKHPKGTAITNTTRVPRSPIGPWRPSPTILFLFPCTRVMESIRANHSTGWKVPANM